VLPKEATVAMDDPRAGLRALVEDYAHACDTRDVDLLVSLFAAGATMSVRMPGQDATPRVVPDDVRVIPSTLSRFERTFHFVGNHRTVTGGNGAASGDTYCFAHHLTSGTDLVMAVHYHDKYVRQDGRWRFATRDVEVLWTETRAVA
jgi:hypothetical protein